MTTNRERGGRAAQHFGEMWEMWGDGQLAAGVFKGVIAHYTHTQPVAKYINGVLTYVDSGVSDFVGMLEGGKQFVAEFKSVAEGRLYKSIVAKDQAEQLEAVARGGGLALLVGEFRDDGSGQRFRFAAPWLSMPWKVARSAESVLPEDMVKWQIGMSTECFVERWHPAGPRSGSWSPVKRRIYATE
jgi:hypothetical protein